MRRFLLPCILTLLYLHANTQSNWKHGRLRVTPDGHYLQYEDGTPFFWLGDTGWELFHRLKLDEIKLYLDNRATKGFNVIQAVALAEFDGLRKPNQYGEVPFKDLDPTKPNDKYFKLIDTVVAMAKERNLYIGLLPTWGDKVTRSWGEGPAVFDSSNAYVYGKWIADRYKKYPNIIWILGGDRPAFRDKDDWRPVWRAMARGIIDATNHQCLIAYHPSGGSYSSSQFIRDEAWLDVNMFQSGHGGGHDVACWELVTRDRAYTPARPTLDGEPNYEDHPVNPWPKWNPDNGYFRDYDVRKQTYRSVFAGACGVTYGHHAVWQFMSAREETINYPDRGWISAIDRPGARQVGYLRKLVESRPMPARIPDSTIIIEGQGAKELHMEAYRGADNSYLMVYFPVGKTAVINTSFIPGKTLNLWWFNPQTAETMNNGTLENSGRLTVNTPSAGAGNDWVLVVDDATKKYSAPGK